MTRTATIAQIRLANDHTFAITNHGSAVRTRQGSNGTGRLARGQDQIARDRQQHKESKDAYGREGRKGRALVVLRFHEDQSCALKLKSS